MKNSGCCELLKHYFCLLSVIKNSGAQSKYSVNTQPNELLPIA